MNGEVSLQPPEVRHPFWGYADVGRFIGFAFLASVIAAGVLQVGIRWMHLNPLRKIVVALTGQFLFYGLLFSAVFLMFKLQYNRPFWRSLGWIPAPLSPVLSFALGISLALAVAATAALLKTPDLDTPMKQLLSDRNSLLLVGLFGTTLGPLCEELIFRGFLQPLFVRSLGVVAGIALTAIPFGLLHLQEYGWSWRHGLLISLAGFGFGWIRQKAGSTRASTLMHAAYNLTFFLGLLAQGRNFPKAC